MNISYSASDFFNTVLSNENTYISSYQKRVREADINVQDLQEEIENFRKNLRHLKNFDSDTVTRSKLEKYLEKFAESYNEFKDSGDKITDKELAKTLSKLEDFMEENKKSLKKLGLKESDGEWIFDNELLEDIKDSDMNKLFEGKAAIFKQMDRLMRKVEKKAEEEEYQMVLHNFHTVSKYSSEEMEQAMASSGLVTTMDYIHAANAAVQSYDSSTGDTSNEVTSGLQALCADYNNIVSNPTESVKEYVGYMVEKTKAYEADLNHVGITIQDGKLMCTVGKLVDNTYKNSYAALFGENAAYGNLMKTYAKNMFHITMRTESHGITIDSYA